MPGAVHWRRLADGGEPDAFSYGASDEFERALSLERHREGIAFAKQRGTHRRRKKSLSDPEIADLGRQFDAGDKKAQFVRELGISREASHQHLRVVAP
jgi:DNA invertase Pin-like site-specific DNA recombinase